MFFLILYNLKKEKRPYANSIINANESKDQHKCYY